jgi:hypothetical protein
MYWGWFAHWRRLVNRSSWWLLNWGRFVDWSGRLMLIWRWWLLVISIGWSGEKHHYYCEKQH